MDIFINVLASLLPLVVGYGIGQWQTGQSKGIGHRIGERLGLHNGSGAQSGAQDKRQSAHRRAR